jgi:hypothetical protein
MKTQEGRKGEGGIRFWLRIKISPGGRGKFGKCFKRFEFALEISCTD